jgi:hypothetical protein
VFGRAPLAAFHLARYAARTRTSRRAAARSLAYSCESTSLAKRREIRQATPTWLAPAAGEDFRRRLIQTSQPGWSVASNHRYVRSRRAIFMLIEALETQARRDGLEYRAPILDLEFVSTLHLLIPNFQFFDRAFLIHTHFPGYLPAKLLRRNSKAHFGSVMFGPMAADFAEMWDGKGLPEDLVIAPELPAAWRRKEDGLSTAGVVRRCNGMDETRGPAVKFMYAGDVIECEQELSLPRATDSSSPDTSIKVRRVEALSALPERTFVSRGLMIGNEWSLGRCSGAVSLSECSVCGWRAGSARCQRDGDSSSCRSSARSTRRSIRRKDRLASIVPCSSWQERSAAL